MRSARPASSFFHCVGKKPAGPLGHREIWTCDDPLDGSAYLLLCASLGQRDYRSNIALCFTHQGQSPALGRKTSSECLRLLP